MTGYFYLAMCLLCLLTIIMLKITYKSLALKKVIHYTKPGDCESKGRIFFTKRIDSNRFAIGIDSNRESECCSFQGISQFYLHTHAFICNRKEPYLPLPSQLWLVLIYRPRRDGRLSRPWCEVAPAEIRTCNLPIANPALYHTATSAPTAPGNSGAPISSAVATET